MPKHGKKHRVAAEKVDPDAKYELKEALGLATAVKSEKFDESVDVAIRLSVDPRKADQNIRGSVVLPKGTGKKFRVLVFAKGEKEKEARDAGAEAVGGDDLVKKIQEGWMEFDRVVATPDMMGQVGKLGKILGPRGLMPNPKTGTVTFDVKQAVESIQAGKVDYRVDKAGIVHASLGRASFSVEALEENFHSLMTALVKAKPASSKGHYVKGISVSTTMGVGVRVVNTPN
ncbi:MAG TPA: 50S ribosomal protein L1 [Nitrospina sp.]|jgi:large subunit ribosomal protein L1|nr:50S ribosomal protein L1 [Nitrospinaceae bacterium]HCK68637.1 50S ribosomal protein L1 [Nitrospina sp.]HIL72099.1 50S ribosomal protein L1 [Verrucomicrobiota bacterium]|tara:strand:- start:281 stop:970 length:690 start_codon:yes stop_codon:yes gene_type:complete